MASRASSEIDRVLRYIAETQLGLVTAAQAEAAGVGAQQLAHRRSTGMLIPVFRGVMRLAGVDPPPNSLPLAAALAVRGSCVAGPTAGMILGLPVGKAFTQLTAEAVLTVQRPSMPRVSGIIVVRLSHPLPSRPFPPGCSSAGSTPVPPFTARPRPCFPGVRLATPAATLLLLPRFVDPSTVERCLDHCLVHRLVTVATVRKLIESLPNQSVSGRRLLLDLLSDRADGVGHRSRKEQEVAGWLTNAELRGWRRNFEVVTGDGIRIEIDFAWPDSKIALEVSPFFTHGTRATQERDVVRRRLLVQMGWTVVEAADPDLINRAAFQRVVDVLRNLVQ